MIAPLRLTLCLVLAAFLISDSLVLGLRGALYRSGRSAMMPNGYQEFLRFGRSAPHISKEDSRGRFGLGEDFDLGNEAVLLKFL
ncbi:hypothetical protein L596_027339 [Steinernema carpocapsae]|uniref:Uncharacterized protein n=1 Tax=Steinernema carpocapsae TaxID=34508 RepID=A0A4U5M415_STECR|nr:hypothetical protein L596_027339 [Steinernema carpocapsae]